MHVAPTPAVASTINRVPSSTYRFQLRPDCGLREIRELLPYLRQLGISDVYLSPLFRARAESAHGYDVVDHGAIDPVFGSLTEFQALAEAVRDAGMGILLDIVPNHMGINDSGNVWWNDVLENGETSAYADYFDIEWQPPARNMQHKVLLPFLGEPFGKVLEKGELQLVYERQRLLLTYFDRRLPLAPATWPAVLEAALATLDPNEEPGGPATDDVIELESIVAQLRHLPPRGPQSFETMREQYREQLVARRRLHELVERAQAIRAAVNAALADFNGREGEPRSFDKLEALLDEQWYRLAYWRVASDEINYRRFFDINDLAAIRVEDPRVFEAVHRLVARFLEERWIIGLRIDHPDGLLDPAAYFDALHALYRRSRVEEDGPPEIYLVAEKILSGDEELMPSWRVAGTTGYDLLNVIGRLQVDGEGLAELRGAYEQLTGVDESAAEVLYLSKRAVLLGAMASELQMLATQLHRCAVEHRAARDFTLPTLQQALREVIACMSVYRTYVLPQGWDVTETDYRRVATAVRMAKRRNPTFPTAVFDFISSVLLLEHPPGLSDEQAAARRRFALRMQQVTGPVTAKGVEDTAFYRYYPLASLNEVGGELDATALATEEFHRLMQRRSESWPHSMSATATHDTKRGEDIRARLHVLSEIPERWIETVEGWRRMNAPLTEASEEKTTIDRNAEYLLYQTLVGTWLGPASVGVEPDEYVERIVAYMHKALREAKVHTSWMNPSVDYEEAVERLVRELLAGESSAAFRQELDEFVESIAAAGYVNGLVQTVLKMTLPGVPDFYQGTEWWDFNLVDPDNRRPVDFVARCDMLDVLARGYEQDPALVAKEVSHAWPDPSAKMLAIWRTLRLRASRPELFASGEYVPLAAEGPLADHVVAFARRLGDEWAVVAVPLHVQRLREETRAKPASGGLGVDWKGTMLVLPAEAPQAWRYEFTGTALRAKRADRGGSTLEINDLLSPLPAAVVSSTS